MKKAAIKNYPLRVTHKARATSFVSGTGLAKPSRIMSNNDLAQLVDTSDEWISSRSGIKTRYIAEGETATDLATSAAQAALASAGLQASDIGLIIVASLTPDSKMPAVACRVQARLGIPNAAAFDLSAACSGFVYALSTADALLMSGLADHALVIGVEVLSAVLDWNDRSTCVLFGDGAGAAVLSKKSSDDDSGIMSLVWGAQGEDGDDVDALMLGLRNDAGAYMRMQGRAVYKFAVGVVPEVLEALLDTSGLSAEQVDWVVAHQANQRILDAAAQRSGIPAERWFHNLEAYGNTSAASIAIALAEMQDQGLLQKGQNIFLLGFGGGLTYGGAYLKW